MIENPHAAHIEELLEGLNEPQREAVTHGEGPLLILAGAGSGKTRVLTHRIAYLIYTDQVQPGEILAITFTNKAASEMRERVERLLGHGTRGMWLMTFHAACARILRVEAARLGYTRQFTIYDQADSRRLTKRCADAIGVDPKRFTPAAIQNQISSAKNKLLDAAAYREQAATPFEEMIAEVYEIYERDMRRMNAMDFDDLLFRTVNLLELYDEVRERYTQSFRHILVDEYQDTNKAQYRLLQLLVTEPGQPGGERSASRPSYAGPLGHRNLAVVGDDAQSIYGFRGADVRNILGFQEDFPDARLIKLEQNYRSTDTILQAANAVISNNPGRIAKRLWSDLGRGDQIQLWRLGDEHAEARFLVGEIERLVEEGESRSEIAVLYRTNAMSRAIEDAFTRSKLDYQIVGGTRFYERLEIKDAIAYLSVLGNPFDAVSFSRIVNSPRRGLGDKSLARLTGYANTLGISIWEAAGQAGQIPGLGAAAIKSMSRFMETMSELQALTGTAGDDAIPIAIADLLEAVLNQTGYVDALREERSFEAEGRIENLEELVNAAREFDDRAEEGSGTLDRFLQEVALVADADTRDDTAGLVTLMTLHNAKGLEYPTVFIAGCEEGVFPHSKAIEERALDEERRLCYVGITRAMRKLYLSYAARRMVFGNRAGGAPSMFLREIPAELIDKRGDGGLHAGAYGGGFVPATSRRQDWRPPAHGDTSWNRAPSDEHARERREASAALSFRLGEDVVHPEFGDGVVTAVRPDGIVVRFATDGRERTLLAEYAPLTRR